MNTEWNHWENVQKTSEFICVHWAALWRKGSELSCRWAVIYLMWILHKEFEARNSKCIFWFCLFLMGWDVSNFCKACQHPIYPMLSPRQKDLTFFLQGNRETESLDIGSGVTLSLEKNSGRLLSVLLQILSYFTTSKYSIQADVWEHMQILDVNKLLVVGV